MNYPPLPIPPQPQPDQSAELYGLAILKYVIQTDCAVMLSDEQLALALHVAPIAGAVHVQIGPDKDRQVDYRTAAADLVAAAKRSILSCQRIRVLLATETAAAAAQLAQPAADQDDDRPDGGSRVPRQPAPAAPRPSTYTPPVPDLRF